MGIRPNRLGGYTEVRTASGRVVAYIPAPCDHADAIPVESLLREVVAWLCPDCDAQLPARWA